MRAHARREDGFSLIELMIVMSMALVILAATLLAFNSFYQRSKQNQVLNDSAEQARNGMDTAARQLRNLANQDPSQLTTTIALASPYDLVFQTSDPSRKWVRYCLDTTNAGAAGASTSRGQLWESETATATAPAGAMLGSCPGTGWVSRRLVADRITNRMSGRDFHVFDYACSTASTSTCSTPPVAADYPKIANISAQLYVDPNPGKAPAELRVASGIYLRNQNEKPTADFASTQLGGQAVILNASRSSDPEGRTLAYDWFYGNGTVSLTPAEACATDIKQKENGTSLIYLGQGVTFRYTRPNTYASPMQIQLVVRDPGCLYDTKVQSVTIP